MLDRAYAVLEVKSLDLERRTITGIAATPTPDRAGDIFEPSGATFAAEIPLLLHHDKQRPVGSARLQTSGHALLFEATLARIETPGPLRDRLEETFQSLTAGLLKGVSVGFRGLRDGVKILKSGGLHFLKTEICELSLVTIPANVDATILTVKSADAPYVSPLPARAGLLERTPMTTAERITTLEHSRAAKVAQMQNLMTKAGEEGVTLAGGPDAESYDALEIEVKNLDGDLSRYRTLEALNQAGAKPVPTMTTPTYTRVQVKSNVEPGTAFLRYCQAKCYGRGDSMRELAFAQQWKDSTPEVELVLKAAVAAGNTTDATWAGPLAALQPLADEFLALLRPATYLGRIPNFLRVPFNVSVPSQTGGGTYSWVGQGAPKPVTKLQFGSISLGITKCAGIIIITEELAKVSSPSAEAVIRRDMIEGIAQFLDSEFIDPAKAAVANVTPGSVTNGVTPITSAGTTPANGRTDIQALINALTTAGISASRAALIMSETNAAALGAGLNPLGQPLFPGLTVTGGSIMGVPVYPSQTAGTTVALIAADCILYADDGGVTIDVSREASVQMDSAPMNPADATVVMTSLWQSNYVGLRAERFINWKKARTGCVQYTVATYTA